MHVQDHPKFQSIADEAPLLYSREQQMGAEKKAYPMKLGEAVQKGIIGSQTLAYFIGRTYLFMKKIGMDPQRLRFRQHLQNEMAHYASDCWDAEAESSYGWIECAGLSDRSAFDLKVQSSLMIRSHDVQYARIGMGPFTVKSQHMYLRRQFDICLVAWQHLRAQLHMLVISLAAMVCQVLPARVLS